MVNRGYAVCTAALVAATQLAAPQTRELESVLHTAAEYMAQYERAVTAVVAEEDYVQAIPSERRGRRMKSELVMIAEGANGWVEFRDVFEVDGKPVRDRDQRIVNLFMKPTNGAIAQGRRIADESARFNISPLRFTFTRTLNVPLTALRFLRAANQSRSEWTPGGEERREGRTVRVVRFRERAEPTLIGSKERSTTAGVFWIEPSDGSVCRSQLKVVQPHVSATITVDYERHPTIKLWLPASMKESYQISGSAPGPAIDGAARYSNFRQFKVETDISIK